MVGAPGTRAGPGAAGGVREAVVEDANSGNLLLVEDDPAAAATLRDTLEQEGYRVEQVQDGRAAYTCLQDPQAEFDLILLHLPPPRSTAASFLAEIYRHVLRSTPIIVVCRADAVRDALDEVRRGALTILPEPWSPELVIQTVARGMEQRALYRELRHLQGRENELKQRNRVLAQRNADLFEEARVDVLTGLPNRRRLDEDLNVLDANVQRRTDRFAIALVDVDDFGRFNKRYGVRVGDRVLQLVATTLRDACRQGDLVYRAKEQSSDPAYRLGGDEFVLILASPQVDHAIAAMQRIRDRLAADQEGGDGDLPRESVTISVGLAAHVPGDGLGMDELLLEANEQLKAAKEAGGDAIRPSSGDAGSARAHALRGGLPSV